MENLIKTKIDIELKNGAIKLDDKDAYRWALICSEHALNFFDFKNKTNLNHALQTINNNLDTISKPLAKEISNNLKKQADELKSLTPALSCMLYAFYHTVAILINKEHAIYSAIYSANAIYFETNIKENFLKEKEYQLEKLNKFLIMYEN